ncbi:MAG: folate-binding protein YgfZ [Alphaproteobacteria bacterium]|nr:folate-binding protein YgfZ [Alphaproteobacteria bacterium]
MADGIDAKDGSGARAAALGSRGVLAVGGPEAKSFLQGLLTNDLGRLAPDRGLAAALLTPQGKLVAELLLIELAEGGLLLEADESLVPMLQKKLTLYRLRAKVTIADERARVRVYALFGAGGLPGLDGLVPGEARAAFGGLALGDPRLEGLGARLYLPTEESLEPLLAAGYAPAEEGDWRGHRLALGVAEGAGDLPPERLFALEANLAELNAVDFRKGCYVGQELTARMRHRAGLKKRLVPVAAEPFPAQGTVLRAGGRDVGEIVSSAGPGGFALLRTDRLVEEGVGLDGPLEADGTPARIRWPDWLAAPGAEGGAP